MKKAKLLASIISLCFSLAVLTFGVFAANQVNYTLSGNISYQVTDAYVELTTKVYSYTGIGDISTRYDLKDIADGFDDSKTVSDFTTVATAKNLTLKETQTYNSLNNSGTISPSLSTTMSLATNTNKAYFVVVNINNLGENTIYARLESATFKAKATPEAETYTVPVSDLSTTNLMRYNTPGKTAIAGNGNANMVFAFGIEDVLYSVEDLQFTYTMEIKDGIYHPNDTVLEYDTTNHYYYVTVGKSRTDNVEIKWKLASVDGGLSKYTQPIYTVEEFSEASLPTGDMVFLQETCLSITKKANAYISSSDPYHRLAVSSSSFTSSGATEQPDLANDYFASDMNLYMTGAVDSSTSFAYELQLGNSATVGYSIFNNILVRTQKDMSKKMDVTQRGKNIFDHTSLQSGKNAKFWLLSADEACRILGGNTTLTYNAGMAWGSAGYYFRSASSATRFMWYTYSGGFIDGNCSFQQKNIRAAFQLAL